MNTVVLSALYVIQLIQTEDYAESNVLLFQWEGTKPVEEVTFVLAEARLNELVERLANIGVADDVVNRGVENARHIHKRGNTRLAFARFVCAYHLLRNVQPERKSNLTHTLFFSQQCNPVHKNSPKLYFIGIILLHFY